MRNFIPALLSDAGSGFDLNNGLSFGERISQGLSVLLFGMGVVFSVLILLWAILVVFRIVFYDIPNKKAKADSEKTATAKVEEAPAPAPVVEVAPEAPAAEAPALDETELVAAITAAIAMTLDKPQTAFRVVSFRRTASK